MSLATLLSTCLGDRDGVALGRDQAARWADWMAPISTQVPEGKDPGYDDDFQRLREEVNKLSGADTELVARLAQQLIMQRCKDLRVATYHLWARLQHDGEAGLADGLSLLATLVEHFGAKVLPERANSRKMALEWLAGEKVLGSLSLHPEVVRAEAERTVAALAWLDHGLQAWPREHRPDLSALHAALSARLAQSGGVDAVVPQHSASCAPSAAAAPMGPITSGRDLLDNGKALATYLRAQPQGWLAAHRLMKSLRWDTVHQPPPQDAIGNTRLAAPRGEYRAQLKRLYLQQRWGELLDQVERVFAEGVNHFWLDLQWYLCQALRKQPPPQDGWAGIVEHDLGMLLERLPGLESLQFNDASAFADETTRHWLAQHVSGNRMAQWPAAPQPAGPADEDDIFSLEGEALALADSHGVEASLAWLTERASARSGCQRWRLRLLMARVAEQFAKVDLALHLLGELDAVGQRHGLDGWEPALDFEVKARLLNLLRHKAQRTDADKPALARRTEALLAALVAIDPVRATVLCG